MFHIMQILAAMLVALAMATAVAHALEYPGKKRLNKEQYLAVQPIYYPGFTVAGGMIGEAGGTIAVAVLLALTPTDTVSFWLTLVSLLGMIGMQIVYWVFTHPVNRFWLQSTNVGSMGSGFFSMSQASGDVGEDWTRLRDRWEYSHLARAGFVTLSFFMLLLAIVMFDKASN